VNWINAEWMTQLTANPLLVKETRRPNKLSARAALKLDFGAGLVASAFSIAYFLLVRDIGLISLIAALYCLAVLSMPPFVAYTAAILTVNDMRASQFELLQLTAISNTRLIEGYILTALYRCRGFLAVLIGIAPFAIIWGIYLSVYEVYIRCVQYRLPSSSYNCEPPSPILVPLALMAFMILIISVVGVCLLSASLGVLLAALSRSRFLSGISALILALIASCSLVLVPMNNNVLNMFLASLIYVSFPYLFSLSAILTARPIARKRS